MEAVYIIILLVLAFWIGGAMHKKREIKYGWAVFWTFILGPLWGWAIISLACDKRSIPLGSEETSENSGRDTFEQLHPNGKQLYVVQATTKLAAVEHHYKDMDCLGEILHPFGAWATSEENAIKKYHEYIPVACLENFEFTCKKADV